MVRIFSLNRAMHEVFFDAFIETCAAAEDFYDYEYEVERKKAEDEALGEFLDRWFGTPETQLDDDL